MDVFVGTRARAHYSPVPLGAEPCDSVRIMWLVCSSVSSLNTPQSSALGQVALHLQSFTNVDVSHYVFVVLFLVSARCDRMSIRHLLLFPGFHRHILCALIPLELCFSLAHALSRRPCLRMRSSLPFPVKFSRQSFWFVLNIRGFVVLSFFHAMQALHNPDNQQFDHQPRPSGILSSDVTFVVNFNSGYSICHGMSHKLFQFAVPCIVQWLSRPTLASHKVIFWQFSKLLLFDHDAYDSQVN